MRLKPSICGLLFWLASQAALAADAYPHSAEGTAGRAVDSWPSATNKVFVSEYPSDGGTRLCTVTISPRTQGPHRYLSIQHFSGQNGFTFVAYQEDWFLQQGTIIQLTAIFDHKSVVGLIGTGMGPEIKLGHDFGATTKINTLLSASESLDIDFPGRAGLTWSIGLQGLPKAMASLRLCASKPPTT